MLISKDFAGIVAWRDADGKTGLDYVIQFVAKLLDPIAEESGAIFIGGLITKLITCSGDALTDVLPELLKAVALRLDNAKNASFIQTLVMVFAQLFVRETYPMDMIVSFLAGLECKGGRNGLEMLVSVWCENHGSFVGFYECKVSAVGLAKLMGDARTVGMIVRGDIVVTEKIMTRSRAKKAPDTYTNVVFGVKVVKLLVADYVGYMTGCGREEISEDGDDGSDSGEWEDCGGGFAGFEAGELATLGNLVSGGAKGFDKETDADVIDDPVYGYDMVEWIGLWFREVLGGGGEIVGECVRGLSAGEKEVLERVMQ